MTVVKTLVRENAAGNRLEATILQRPIGFSVKYYVNHIYKHEELFERKDLNQVEQIANSWLSEVRTLNG
jgi:hypothetical protein